MASNDKLKGRHASRGNNFLPMEDNDHKVIEAMERYGGSFVKALAVAFYRADHINTQKLKSAFPEYWEQYKKMAE